MAIQTGRRDFCKHQFYVVPNKRRNNMGSLKWILLGIFLIITGLGLLGVGLGGVLSIIAGICALIAGVLFLINR